MTPEHPRGAEWSGGGPVTALRNSWSSADLISKARQAVTIWRGGRRVPLKEHITQLPPAGSVAQTGENVGRAGQSPLTSFPTETT